MGGGIRICEAPIKKKKKNKLIDINAKYEKGKNIQEIPETELVIGINGSSEIDKNPKDPRNNSREYFVYGWVSPGGEPFYTRESDAFPNPRWNMVFKVYSGKLNSGMLLKIEVYRCESYAGAGASHGCALVGRGQLSVPKKFMRDSEIKRCGLVTPEGLAAGFVYVELMLKKVIFGRQKLV